MEWCWLHMPGGSQPEGSNSGSTSHSAWAARIWPLHPLVCHGSHFSDRDNAFLCFASPFFFLIFSLYECCPPSLLPSALPPWGPSYSVSSVTLAPIECAPLPDGASFSICPSCPICPQFHCLRYRHHKL